MDARAGAAIEDYNLAKARLDAAQAELDETQRRVRELTAQEQVLRDATEGFVRRLYQNGPTSPLDAVLSTSDGPSSAVLLQRLTARHQAQAEALGAVMVERREEQARLADQRKVAAEAEQLTAARREAVETELAAQKDVVSQLRGQVAAAERHLEDEVAAEQRRRAAERARRAAEQAAQRAAEEAARQAETSAPSTSDAPAPPPPGVRRSADAAVDAALSQVGKPYRWGGSGPDSYDCSGLTSWAWRHAGVSLPHSSRMQYSATRRISRSDLSPGDLVFFGSPIHHVAMYIGGGDVVEAPYSGTTVRVNSRALSRSDITGYGRP